MYLPFASLTNWQQSKPGVRTVYSNRNRVSVSNWYPYAWPWITFAESTITFADARNLYCCFHNEPWTTPEQAYELMKTNGAPTFFCHITDESGLTLTGTSNKVCFSHYVSRQDLKSCKGVDRFWFTNFTDMAENWPMPQYWATATPWEARNLMVMRDYNNSSRVLELDWTKKPITNFP